MSQQKLISCWLAAGLRTETALRSDLAAHFSLHHRNRIEISVKMVYGTPPSSQGVTSSGVKKHHAHSATRVASSAVLERRSGSRSAREHRPPRPASNCRLRLASQPPQPPFRCQLRVSCLRSVQSLRACGCLLSTALTMYCRRISSAPRWRVVARSSKPDHRFEVVCLPCNAMDADPVR